MRARCARLTTGGKAASVGDVEPGSAIEHPAERPDLLVRKKQTADNDERRSEHRGRRHREMSRRNEAPGKRGAPAFHLSGTEAALDEPKPFATPLKHKRLFAPRLQDREGQSTETELLSYATAKDNYSGQVVLCEAVAEVGSPPATKAPRSGAEALSGEGGTGISAGAARKSGRWTETAGLHSTDMNRAVLPDILCAAFAVIVAVLAQHVVMHRSDGACFSASTWLKEMDKQCNSADCLTAVKFIAAAMNASAEPCAKSYTLACGRWRSSAPASTIEPDWTSPTDGNASCTASMRSGCVAPANESLLRAAQESATSDVQVSHVGKVYAPCLASFVDKRPGESEVPSCRIVMQDVQSVQYFWTQR
ncbi:uncharacterized protein [Dermacentor albipictus]|uniref:uncharacterized protein n=1 Tax=Dermacentor albipictus TaxID=60249 RepID=UPI0038FC02CF